MHDLLYFILFLHDRKGCGARSMHVSFLAGHIPISGESTVECISKEDVLGPGVAVKCQLRKCGTGIT